MSAILKLKDGRELELVLSEGNSKGSVYLSIADMFGNPYTGGHILEITTSGKLFRHWNLDRDTGIQTTKEDGYHRIEEVDMTGLLEDILKTD